MAESVLLEKSEPPARPPEDRLAEDDELRRGYRWMVSLEFLIHAKGD